MLGKRQEAISRMGQTEVVRIIKNFMAAMKSETF